MSIRELFAGEGTFMRIVFGFAVVAAALHALQLIAYTILGLLGQGWPTSAMLVNVLAISFVWQWGTARCWRKRALGIGSGRRIDVTTVPAGTFSTPGGRPSEELLAAVERARQRNRATYDFRR